MRALVLAILLLWASVAAAQEVPASPAPESKTLVVDGVRGRWFEMGVAGVLLEEHLQVPELKKLADAAEQLAGARKAQLEVKEERLQLCADRAALSERRADAAEAGMQAALKDAAESRADAQSLKRSPVLWAGVGAAFTAALVVLTAAFAH